MMKAIGSMIMAGLMIAGGTAALANDRAEGKRPDRVRAGKAEKTCGQDEQGGYGRRQCREAWRVHQKARHEAGKAAWEAARNTEDPHEALALLRAHRVEQFAAGQAFHAQQWQQHEQRVAARLEAKNVPEDKRDGVLDKMRSRHENAREKAQTHQARVLEQFDALAAKEDLTHQDIRKAVHKAVRQHVRRRHDRGDPDNGRRRKSGRGVMKNAPDA